MAKAKDSWRLKRAVATLRGMETSVGLLLLRSVMDSGGDIAASDLFSGWDGEISRDCSALVVGGWISVVSVVSGGAAIVESVATLSKLSGREMVKKSEPRVPMGALGSSIS